MRSAMRGPGVMKPKAAIVMTGLPASGKSSLGRSLALQLGWACLDKDDFLEQLYEQYGTADMFARRSLSRQADQAFQSAACALDTAILVSHWAPSAAALGVADTGTPTDWLAEHFGHIIEIYCRCPADVATERFFSRTRHPGHLDGQRSRAQFAQKMRMMAPGYPLHLGALIEADTTAHRDTDTLLRQLKAQLRLAI